MSVFSCVFLGLIKGKVWLDFILRLICFFALNKQFWLIFLSSMTAFFHMRSVETPADISSTSETCLMLGFDWNFKQVRWWNKYRFFALNVWLNFILLFMNFWLLLIEIQNVLVVFQLQFKPKIWTYIGLDFLDGSNCILKSWIVFFHIIGDD